MNWPSGVLTTLFKRHLADWMSVVWVVTLPVYPTLLPPAVHPTHLGLVF
jgi:hypothetical protein